MEWNAIFLSLKVATVVVIFMMPLAIFIGYKLARTERLHWRLLVETLMALPLVLPPVATGYLLLILFRSEGPVGLFLSRFLGVTIPFHFLGVVLAAVVVSLPLAVRSVRVSMEGIEPQLEEAALTLGASRAQTFFCITLPLAWPGILSAVLLTFIRSLGEFGATLVLAGNIENETRTMSVALWTYLQEPGGQNSAFRLLCASVLFGCICLFISELFVRKLRHCRTD
jgi:molybdate transport system permease protein